MYNILSTHLMETPASNFAVNTIHIYIMSIRNNNLKNDFKPNLDESCNGRNKNDLSNNLYQPFTWSVSIRYILLTLYYHYIYLVTLKVKHYIIYI